MPNSSPITTIQHPIFAHAKIKVYVKRDDLIHPIISGNKWRKLKYNIEAAKASGKTGIVSFGGAYSNHIHALSYACKLNQLNAVGIIRGEPHYQNNATLSQASSWGMDCQFVDRLTYKRRSHAGYLAQLQKMYANYLIVPEGGTNQLALKGVAEVITELDQQLNYDTIITPVGSAGTISGLISADNNRHQILGINVLKGAHYLKEEIEHLLSNQTHTLNNWRLFNDFHLGGYAKFSTDDANTLANINQQMGITFEPVYSGKMMLGFLTLVEQGYFEAGQTVVLLHTGGLQGINGLLERKKLASDQWPWQLVQ